MWTMLAGVPGKLKTLLDRLTATRAALLDNLNATVSSRAPAATALSNAVWTDARAGKIDLIAPALRSLQGGYLNSTTLNSGSGEDVRFVDVTISAVDTAKSLCLFEGGGGTGTGSGAEGASRWKSGSTGVQGLTVRLINSTTLRVSSVSTFPERFNGRWTVVEFN